MAKKAKEDPELLHCSFCGKDQSKVRKLIAGPGVYICDECLGLCNEIIANDTSEAPWPSQLDELDTEEVLRRLQPSANLIRGVERTLQGTVRVLRDRGVTWARIGETLGVSRQAAWERFSGEE